MMFSSMLDGLIPLHPLPVPMACRTRTLLVDPGMMVRKGTFNVSLLRRAKLRDGLRRKLRMSAVACSCSSIVALAHSLAIGVVAVGRIPFHKAYSEALSSWSDEDMIVVVMKTN